MKLQSPIFSQQSFLIFCLMIWALVWVITSIYFIVPEIIYYKVALGFSAETLRAYHVIYHRETADYYKILKECDQALPPSQELQIILPAEPGHRFMFLREKGRYILYPRNYGDNDTPRDYILVYGQKDYVIPPGYEIIKSFGIDKYLLAKKKI